MSKKIVQRLTILFCVDAAGGGLVLTSFIALWSVAFAPNSAVAVGLLLARALFSQMDVPARQSYVMSVVTPAERAAAAAYTNVPRSLAAATTPAFAGWLLTRGTFGWHLVIGGGLKIAYDLALLQPIRSERLGGGPIGRIQPRALAGMSTAPTHCQRRKALVPSV